MTATVRSPPRAAVARGVDVRGLRHHFTRWDGRAVPSRCSCCTAGWMRATPSITWWMRCRHAARASHRTGAAWSERLAGRRLLVSGLHGKTWTRCWITLAGPAGDAGRSQHGRQHRVLYAGVRPERVRRVVSSKASGLARPTRRRPLRPVAGPAAGAAGVRPLPVAGCVCAPAGTPQSAASPRAAPTFIAEAWAEADRQTAACRRDSGPAHKRVNPVLYRREEAEACWQRGAGARAVRDCGAVRLHDPVRGGRAARGHGALHPPSRGVRDRRRKPHGAPRAAGASSRRCSNRFSGAADRRSGGGRGPYNRRKDAGER